MNQYLLSVHMVEGEAPLADADTQVAYAAVDRFNQELQDEGAWVFAGGLFPADTATVVRINDSGDVVMTDGPFAESKKHLGGFWVVVAEDLDVAVVLAERAARACGGPVEVRPFQLD